MLIAGRGMLQIIIVLGVSGGIPASRVVRDLLDPRLRGRLGRYGAARQ